LPTDWDSIQTIADMRLAAERRAHRMVFDYIDGGSEDEQTLARNRNAFAEHHLLHRVLTGAEKPDLSTRFLGQALTVPFVLSPSAGNRLFHTEGEASVARAAGELGTAYALSTLATTSIETVATATQCHKWFQLYVWKDRALVADMLQRAKASGFSILILTVDLPVAGKRERDYRNGFTIPPKRGPKQLIEALRHPAWALDYLKGPPISYANFDGKADAISLNSFVAQQLSASFNWKDAEWVLQAWNGPVILKGVMHPADAIRAKAEGFAAVSVSNHGGRQLDGEAAPLDVLPAVRQAVGPDYPLILDGGIRRGTDMLKALCLGANLVSFARPYLYGLAAGGYPGVRRALQILRDEFFLGMQLIGAHDLNALTPDLLLPRAASR
jgi:L-lactate dehydrogenase (cytochrome)